MGIIQRRKAILLNEPHPVTISDSLAHFETDMKCLIEITGNGNVTICGKNLFDKNTVTHGKYINSSGSIVNSPSGYDWCISDYIPVKTKIAYMMNGGAGSSPYSAWYSADKTLISTWKQEAGNNTSQKRTANVPSNAKYLRFSILNTTTSIGNNLDNFLLVLGDASDLGDYDYENYNGTTSSTLTGRKSLKGINNVWSDSGDITVKYWKH